MLVSLKALELATQRQELAARKELSPRLCNLPGAWPSSIYLASSWLSLAGVLCGAYGAHVELASPDRPHSTRGNSCLVLWIGPRSCGWVGHRPFGGNYYYSVKWIYY